MKPLATRLVGIAAGLLFATTAQASFHIMQIEQVIGGVNGDNTAQAIQLRMRSVGQNFVASSRVVVRDATGANPILVKDMTTNVANGATGSRVLLMSTGMTTYVSGLTPDFTFTNLIPASYFTAGSLTFEDDFGTIYWRLSWGGASYTGPGTLNITNDPDGNANPPFPGPLPSTSTSALQFTFVATAGSTNNANDYQLTGGDATFTNNANQSRTVTPLPPCSILPGVDLFTTPPGGSSYQDFSGSPIPAGFFDPGSEPFTGTVVFGGQPLGGPLGPTDTIVRRNAIGPLNPGGSVVVPIEIVALSLVSAQPITVNYSGGPSEQWDVRACLSSSSPQQFGQMTIRQDGCTCAEGGTFSSTLPVLPRLTFTRISPPATRVLDFGAMGMQSIVFNANGTWLPADPGFSIVTLPGPVQVDHDCNAGTATVSTQVGTSNFIPGLRMVRCDSSSCVGPPTPIKRMTTEQSQLAAHGVLPAQPCGADTDHDGVCDDADNCRTVANPDQRDFDGDGIGDACDNCPTLKNYCQEDGNGNNVGDVCELANVPDRPIGGVMLGRPVPNPVTGSLSYSVALPREMHVTVSVFDVRGRLIERLLDGTLGAGEHPLTWDARRAGIETGSYFLRLEADGVRQSRKFSVVR